MQNLLQLCNKWEIHLLVLLSFMLQMLLFFTGSLRRCSTNKLLRGIIWVAYLGADFVAVYALGLLSRREIATTEEGQLMESSTLAFFWAPFLLIHLGGQDTITAFAIEDNNLWLRHLLNLVIQVFLALYVFWKLSGNHGVQLLVPGIFVFVSGIIKYGERTVALMCGNLKNITSSNRPNGRMTPDVSVLRGYECGICFALNSLPTIRGLFAGRMYLQSQPFGGVSTHPDDQFPKFLDVQLRVMYDDIYTKAAVLRTRSGVTLRCISQVSAMVALVLFAVSHKQRYTRADIAVTYTLFIGGFFLEFCAMFTMFMASPWIWLWLKAREHRRLSGIAWLLLSSDIAGWAEKRPFWSSSMGQYSFLSYMGCEKPANLSGRVMNTIRKIATAVGIGGEKLFSMSKLLDTRYEAVDDNITQFNMNWIREITGANTRWHRAPQQWQNLGPFLRRTVEKNSPDFVYFILVLHIFTEIQLSAIGSDADDGTAALAGVCRKLSNYMFYLVVAHPSAPMLQVAAGSPEVSLEHMRDRVLRNLRSGSGGDRDAVLRSAGELIREELSIDFPEPRRQTLEELREMWARLLVYAAGKSRPEAHAAELARGGELLTFVWLFLAHHTVGDWGVRIELTDRTVGLINPLCTFRFS